ncbi:hypothetical protein ACP4OV_026767 [Aristida adscensionis]
MDVFIHEDYVKKRNEVRREQRRQQLRMLQLEGSDGVSRPAPASRESPRSTGASPSSVVRSPTATASADTTAEKSAWSSEDRLYDCLKPY